MHKLIWAVAAVLFFAAPVVAAPAEVVGGIEVFSPSEITLCYLDGECENFTGDPACMGDLCLAPTAVMANDALTSGEYEVKVSSPYGKICFTYFVGGLFDQMDCVPVLNPFEAALQGSTISTMSDAPMDRMTPEQAAVEPEVDLTDHLNCKVKTTASAACALLERNNIF